MDLKDFHSLVAEEINRGTALDSAIPGYVRRAARWLERNYTFKYMERFVKITLKTSATYPRTITFPERMKRMEFFRIQLLDGKYHYLRHVHPKDVVRVETGLPEGYWFDGMEYIWIDNTPGEDYLAELSYVQYTDWPTDTSFVPKLLELGEDVLLHQTIIMMGPRLRNAGLVQIHMEEQKMALQTLVQADEELRHSDTTVSMIYTPEE